MTSGNTNPPPPPVPSPRHSTGMVIGAGVLGLVIGALATFVLTGLTLKVRVELPPPPYPQLSTAPVSYPPPPTGPSTTAPIPAPGGLPAPPAPPLPPR
ncbi:hypothetical protein [Mycobacterium angelicum]|uniref:Uncharacterized protein n=1 Tax=Mycobacterium angelicum TaxID=470074 RepID=A0A1W9ZQS7_MYCAN|nr:hypothetical protein [Mycobacterium angelicum]MCV7196629.1 hypothetical protein [Mycobacterium angelicum]ORA19975.1 hypothetical protein BST12_15955 [Mycobacterium angelicum]